MKIRRSHQLGLEEATLRVERVASRLKERFDLTSEWRGGKLEFDGASVNGEISVTEKFVEISVQLGFPLMIMESQIKDSIEQKLDEELS